jgi:hypothetical protein
MLYYWICLSRILSRNQQTIFRLSTQAKLHSHIFTTLSGGILSFKAEENVNANTLQFRLQNYFHNIWKYLEMKK